MKSNALLGWSITLLLAAAVLPMGAAPSLAADQIPWVADFQEACGMAAEQHRLVLLHFYNDNCGPCVRVEQNVFSRPEVAEAIGQNYIAVKVHAGTNAKLASRYRVQQWPTDVVVTRSGMEVFRTVSPQRPEDYIAMLNQVAQQTGIGTARQWKNQMGQTLAAATNTADAAAKNAANEAQKRAEQSYQQANNAIQTSAANAGRQRSQWSQQANDAVQNYEKQAGDSYRQFRQQTGEVAQQVQQQAGGIAQQVQQQAETTRSQWQTTTQKATEEVAQAANGLNDQMHQTAQTLLDRRSAFVPPESSPAAQPAAALQTSSPAGNPVVSNANSATSPSAPAQTSSASASPALTEKPAPAVTTNPWVAGNQPAASGPASPREGWSPPGTAEPPFVPAQPQPMVSPQQASFGDRQMIPVSQAPAIALDGFCPVTLREVFDRNPADRAAWTKGDRRFGAIHNGRTYLFASAEQQQKFLANPDAYAPMLAGCDPVVFAERGQMVDGKRAYGLVTADRQIYLFSDEATLNRFKQAPGNYAGAIQQAKARADAGNIYR